MTLKKQVEEILQNYPETRNSDITLMIELWKHYYSQTLFMGYGITKMPVEEKLCIALNSLYDLPREDNIKRIRAMFNARGKYWPTDLKIARGRGIQEDKWREKLGYPVKSETYYPSKEESYTDKLL